MQIEILLWFLSLPFIVPLIIIAAKWLSKSHNRDKVKLKFWKAVRRVTKRFDKSTISSQCAIFMKPRIESLNTENPEATLPVARIEFSKSMDEVSKVEDRQVFIVLRDSENEAENLVRIAEEYVRQGVLYDARSITDESIQHSVELTIMRQLISRVDEALRIWHKRHYQPCLSDDKIRFTLEKTEYINRFGYLTRMFLSELELTARRIGLLVKPQVVDEAHEWLDFVHSISQWHDEDPEIYRKFPQFVFKLLHIAVGIVLVARVCTIAKYGTSAHEARVLSYLNDSKVSEIFIISAVEENCSYILRVVENTYSDDRVGEVWFSFFRVRSRGKDDVPVIIVRYIKGPSIAPHKKLEAVRELLRVTQKELGIISINRKHLSRWLKEHWQKYFELKRLLNKDEIETIASVLEENGLTIDDLENILTDSDIQERFEKIKAKEEKPFLQPKEQILYKILVAIGKEDDEILKLIK